MKTNLEFIKSWYLKALQKRIEGSNGVRILEDATMSLWLLILCLFMISFANVDGSSVFSVQRNSISLVDVTRSLFGNRNQRLRVKMQPGSLPTQKHVQILSAISLSRRTMAAITWFAESANTNSVGCVLGNGQIMVLALEDSTSVFDMKPLWRRRDISMLKNPTGMFSETIWKDSSSLVNDILIKPMTSQSFN